MIWLLGGYMWLFIHRPFEVWPWLGAYHVERVYMIVTILYWALTVDKQWIHNRLNGAFVCFWLVILASWIVSPFSAVGARTVEDYFKVAVLYVLVITSVRTERDLGQLVVMFLGAMGLYLTHSLWEYHNGRHIYVMGTARMVGVDVTNGDPNSFAGTIVCSLPLVFPLWGQFRQSRLRWLLLGYVGLATTCILLTGSRMGFVGLCALSLIAVLLSKHRLAIMALVAIAAPLAWISLPQDRQNRYLTLIDPSYGPANAQLSAEGRRKGWWDGVKLWKEHPVLGVGPGANGIATGQGGQAHHLYGQLLGDLGTLGAAAFGMVVLGFVANYLNMWRICRQEPSVGDTLSVRLIQSVAVSVVLLLLMGLAGHNLYSYRWLWFGAFQAIALHCLRIAQPVAALEALELVDRDTAEGACL